MSGATTTSFDALPATGFIRQAQLIPHVVPFSSATLWRRCKAGEFPKPVKLSERVTAWRVGDVRAFLDAQQKVGAEVKTPDPTNAASLKHRRAGVRK